MNSVDEHFGAITESITKPFREVMKGYTPFREGDVLFAKITPCMENGKAAIARQLTGGVGYGSTEFHVLRPRSTVLAEWIFFLLRNPSFRKYAAGSFQGAVGQQRVPQDFLERFKIPLPPLSEQQRIVEILQEAEQVRRLRSQAESKTAQLIPASFFHFFGDAEHSFSSSPMRALVHEFRYGTSKSSGRRGTITLRIPNILGERISFDDLVVVDEDADSLERLRLQTGDLLFVRTNGNPDYVGRCGVFDFEEAKRQLGGNSSVIFASYLIRARLKLDLVRPWFLHAFLRSPIGRARVLKQARTAAGQYNINTEGLGSIRIPVPPLDLQDRFLLETIETQQVADMGRLSEKQFSALGNSLLAHAFTGELTAEWREKHQKKLEQEARERDEALKALGATISRPTTAPDIEKIFTRRTDGAYAELSREQHTVLEEAHRGFGGVDYPRWFTAAQVAKRLTGPLHTNTHAVEAHLAVLAARGLIIAVSREEEDPKTGEIIYGNAYRLPLKDSESLLGDEQGNINVDEKGDGLIQEEVIGDKARLREMQRLVRQLEKERML
jgi:type I restriction enzyme, S subunit